MGNSQSNHNFLTGFKEIKKQSSNLMGQISEALQTQTNSLYLMKIHSFVDQTSFKNALKAFKTRHLLKPHKNLLNLRYLQQSTSKQYCGSNYRIYTFYDHIDKDLLEMYNEKLINSTEFKESQLITILQSCINALIYLQDNALRKYHLCKKSIVISGDSIKILDSSLVMAEHPYFSLLTGANIAQDIFLAPELLTDLYKQSYDPYISPKTDIFTLGMLMLHLAFRQPMNQFYNYEKYVIDSKSLIQKVEQMTQYSENLKNLIKSMLEINEEQRPGLITLKQKLETSKRESKFTKKHSPIQKSGNFENFLQNAQIENTIQSEKLPNKEARLQLTIKNSKINSNKTNIQNSTPNRNNLFPNGNISKKKVPINNIEETKKPLVIQMTLNDLDENSPNKKSVLTIEQSPMKKLEPLLYSANPTYGKIPYLSNGYYEGQLLYNQPHGNGISYYKDNKIHYSGSWNRNKFHGFGTLYNEYPEVLQLNNNQEFNYENFDECGDNWIRYEGEFFQGLREGFGTLYIRNNEKFSGCFKKGLAEGYGTYYKNNGSYINGLWSNNRFKK